MGNPVPVLLKQQPLDALLDLPAALNAVVGCGNGLSFYTMPINTAFRGYRTLLTQVSQGDTPVATYQCNAGYVDGWMVFYMLTVVWAEEGVRPKGSGKKIMEHCLRALDVYAKRAAVERGVLLTTGNLTEERAGLPFFTAMGWDTVFLPPKFTRNDVGCGTKAEALHFVATHLDDATIKFRAADEGISFAFYAVNGKEENA